MKKLLWAFLSLSLLLVACNKEENVPLPETANAAQELFFYGVATPDPQISQQGVVQNNNLWHPNAVIRVKFLNDPYNMKEFVKTHAREWENHICPKFEFVESGDAEVRIAFNWNNNRRITWSYTGNNCLFVTDQTKPTMNIAGWQSAAKTEEAKKGDALRAFGQVLGLEYEYRHLAFDPMFDEYEAEDYWMYQQNIISWSEMKRYVLDPLSASSVTQTDEYDALSIMVVPFPDYVAGNSAVAFNTNLSAGDIAFIQELYPPSLCEEEDDGSVLRFQTAKQDITIYLNNISDVEIDWGDGCKETAIRTLSVSRREYTHTYDSAIEHTVRIFGDREAVISMECAFNEITMIDVSKCKSITRLHCNANNITSIDVSKNISLQQLYIRGNKGISKLDISKNINLNHLGVGYCDLSQIDLSNNLLLESVDIEYNRRLSSIDVSMLQHLNTLSISGTSLLGVDISSNTLLRYFYIANTDISELSINSNQELAHIVLNNTPISQDANKLIALVQALPDRSMNSLGNGDLRGVAVYDISIIEICASKKWLLTH